MAVEHPKYITESKFYIQFFFFFVGNDELANFIIRGVLLTIMTLFGLVANTLSIVVFTRPEMKSTINRLLIGKIKVLMAWFQPWTSWGLLRVL